LWGSRQNGEKEVQMTQTTNSWAQRFPAWVPPAAIHYLVHTEDGLSIRALARENACHPSTILRQVRRFEGRRDDPLIDDALRSLAQKTQRAITDGLKEQKAMNCDVGRQSALHSETLTQDRIDQEAKRILRRLCEPQAVLAVAMEMESAVVVRETEEGGSLRTAVVDREIAQAMALKEWITCPEPVGRINRYFITNSGRAALRKLTAADENRASGFSEKRDMFEGADKGWKFEREPGDVRTSRYYVTESPLLGLARRKDRDGEPFLTKDFVAAGERLREDFELSLLGPKITQSWEGFMATPEDGSGDGPVGALAARKRVRDAMADLGPGLGDVVLRCCCLLEGLEVTEKKLGWSARSGKIVLRIALQRLSRHYAETSGQFAPMIG
jgi:hypothetical protein